MVAAAKTEPSLCVFSDDRRYRYLLQHVVAPNSQDSKGLVNFIMLNPSTADEQRLDPTLRRCRGYTLQWGYASFAVTNLFAYRATDPNAMKQAADPIGPDNNSHILRTASIASLVVLGWGSHGSYLSRGAWVHAMLERQLISKAHIFHFGLTANRQPRHPLYLPLDAALVAAF